MNDSHNSDAIPLNAPPLNVDDSDPTNPGDMSLVPVLGVFADSGWNSNHLTRPGGAMKCGTCGEESGSARLDAITIHRIEGSSDPDDMQMVLGIECPLCGARGALVVSYGPNASEQDAEFLGDLGIGDAVEMIVAENLSR